MKLLKKVLLVAGATVLLSSSSLGSSLHYTVQSGETLMGIVYKLGFKSLTESGITVSSGNNNIIFIGEELAYNKKKNKKSRFKLRNKIDLKKFCFKDSNSIHYRSTERCSNMETKKRVVRQKNTNKK